LAVLFIPSGHSQDQILLNRLAIVGQSNDGCAALP
jgi:hypothetical protein